MKKTLPIVALASLLTFGAAVAAEAQPVVSTVQWGRAIPRDDFQRAYNQGFNQGAREGERDARSGRRREYRDNASFRRGSPGWGNNNRSDDAFRRGFAEGYLQGYDRFRGSYGGYGRNDGYGYPQYPQGGYGYPNGGGYYPNGGNRGYSPAAQRGFEDGLRDGRNDARDNDRYEPTRKKKYRDGDDGYNNRYGSRDQYKYEYRQAFQQGYDQGYRQEGRWR
ncbi:MAG TPA: hypothetical protein VMF13_21310 [Luteitalea sp.]|nr:hypothetical protein [Luteitalea sp.]